MLQRCLQSLVKIAEATLYTFMALIDPVSKKGTTLIKNITSQKWHLTTYIANLHVLLLFPEVPKAAVCRYTSK